MKRYAKTIFVAASLAAIGSTSLLAGCAATQLAIEKRELDVQTKMSDTIFLDPTPEAKRTIFVQVRNTSDKQDFDIAADVTSAIAAKGYRVVTDPDKAQFILQANILQVGKVSASAAHMAFGGYGAPLGSAFLAAGAAAGMGARNGAIVGAGLAGGLVELVANSAVKDVYYTAITDVQIKERQRSGVKSHESSMHNVHQGNSGGTTVTYNDDTDYRTYQTRVMSVANKVNLDFNDAVTPLRSGLVRVVSGVF
ncbi:complement resistance protein TraT [Paraburkholderia sp. HP33-1]|uniref:complement resistance protein TraT n=1 Tax=Paraburkholderia sp. HP33-1 TaxID=2883243 RepID=UPI001F312B1B|nr:complement resistance protein TraT [Paraburkholderia sp. HP33-1]